MKEKMVVELDQEHYRKIAIMLILADDEGESIESWVARYIDCDWEQLHQVIEGKEVKLEVFREIAGLFSSPAN